MSTVLKPREAGLGMHERETNSVVTSLRSLATTLTRMTLAISKSLRMSVNKRQWRQPHVGAFFQYARGDQHMLQLSNRQLQWGQSLGGADKEAELTQLRKVGSDKVSGNSKSTTMYPQEEGGQNTKFLLRPNCFVCTHTSLCCCTHESIAIKRIHHWQANTIPVHNSTAPRMTSHHASIYVHMHTSLPEEQK